MSSSTMMPESTDPRVWDAYIASAPNYATAQDRIEAAVTAGVDFGALLRAQADR